MTKKTIYIIISIMLYCVVLGYSYVNYVSPLFSYSGFYLDFSYTKLIIFILSNICMLFVLKFDYNIDNLLVFLLYINSVIPMLSLFYLQNLSYKYFMIVFLSYFTIFTLIRLLPKVKISFLSDVSLKEKHFVTLLFIIVTFLVIVRIIQLGGIDSRAFAFDELYELRSEIKTAGMWGYLHNWLTKVFIPVLMIYYLHNKKYLLFFIVSMYQFSLFASTGQKTLLLSIGLILSCFFLRKWNRWYFGLPMFYTIISISSMLMYSVFKNVAGVGLFLVRQIFLPPFIGNKYIIFFSDNPRLHFSEGMIGKIFNLTSPYDIDAANIISGRMDVYENTGFIFDAYANGGFFGIVAIILFFVLLLKLLVSLSSSNNKLLYFGFMVYPIIILNDGSLLSVMLTHGVFLIVIIIYLLESMRNKKNEV
ncbi:hypothetical protein [Vagococcus fluvialis]|uniref:hypothetical protein n=1 Tax=Vagococcus fluvialis TaxID=2738 RepID=UPI002B30D4F7|nr:hypothetical protein QDW48_03790 [Vagococcus fluvialis]